MTRTPAASLENVTERLVLWDFDGTLAFRPGLWSGCVIEVLDARAPGHGVAIESVRAGLAGGFPWHRADQPHPHPGDSERWWEPVEGLIADTLARCGVERGECAELAREVRLRFIDPAIGWQLCDDAVAALSSVRDAGWTNAILSNHVPELPELAAGLGLAEHVDRVFTSALVGVDKPHPRFFRHVLDAYGDPPEVWMVGDNPRADIAGAEAAGCRAILVHTTAPGVRHNAAGLLDASAIILCAVQS